MKSKLLLLAFTVLTIIKATATVHMISVQDFSFTPSSLTVHPGDTVMWMWVNGTHTTTSTSVPSGANPWNSNITSVTTFFNYVPTVPATYSYRCNIHPSLMTGNFTVTNPAATPVATASQSFDAWPNPAKNVMHIVFASAAQPVTVSMISMDGREVLRKNYLAVKETDLDIAGVPEGSYILRTEQNSSVITRKVAVQH